MSYKLTYILKNLTALLIFFSWSCSSQPSFKPLTRSSLSILLYNHRAISSSWSASAPSFWPGMHHLYDLHHNLYLHHPDLHQQPGHTIIIVFYSKVCTMLTTRTVRLNCVLISPPVSIAISIIILPEELIITYKTDRSKF